MTHPSRPSNLARRCRRAGGPVLLAACALCATGAVAQQAPVAAATTLEDVVVTGVRASLENALLEKRDADTIVDSISAEELGKFPSRNVADALGNIPGVVVQRMNGAGGDQAVTSGGEGQFITIRGLGQGFSIVTLNDRILATDNVGRDFAFDVLPAEMIIGADVYKAAQASGLEGSTGAWVNLRSARPFDYKGKGLQLFGSADGEYSQLARNWGRRLTGVVSNTFADDRLGALLSVSYSKRDVRADNLHEYSATTDSEANWNTDFNGNGVIDQSGAQFLWPHFYSVGTILARFERLGVTTALQYQPTDRLTLTLDGLYTRYDTMTDNYAASFHLDPREDATQTDPASQKWSNVTADSNGVITGFHINNLVAEVLNDHKPRVVDTRLFGLKAAWDTTDTLHLDGDVYISQATRNSGGQSQFVVAGIPGSTGVFSTNPGGLPNLDVTIPGGRTLDQATDADYHVHYIGIQGDNLRDRVVSGKLDGKLDLSWGRLKALKLGFLQTDRRKTDTVIDNANTTSCSYCGYPFTFADINAAVIRPFPVSGLLSRVSGNFPRNFATFNIGTYLNSLSKADNNPAIIDPNTGLPYPPGYSVQVLQPDLPVSFDVDERTTAGYLQADFAGDRWRADVGVRVVHTTTRSSGHSIEILSIVKRPGAQADYIVTLSDPVPVSGGGSYTKPLPAANFSYDLRPDLRIRAAAAKVISRPSLDQLSSASDASAAASGTFLIFNSGNPNLRPTDADQYDLSLEWYISPQSYVSLAGFRKNLRNFVTTAPVNTVIAGQQFVVSTVLNGNDATIKGAELAGQYIFDNGFGVLANMTTTSSEAHLDGFTGGLEGVIPRSYNLKLLYEKFGWSNQVTYSYNSSYTQQLLGTAGVSVITEPYKELSATLSYEFAHHYTAFVEGTNLLNQSERAYHTYRSVPAQYQLSGRFVFVGVRARL